MKNKSSIGKRIIELDVLRGFCVIMMIFDHTMYDLWGLLPSVFVYPNGEISSFLADTAYLYWNWEVRTLVRYVIVFFFMALVGVCASFSKSNLKRGSMLMAAALALSAVMYGVAYVLNNPNMNISFGTLHCIALALISVGLCLKFIQNKWFYLVIGLLMVAAGIYFGQDVTYLSYTRTPLPEIILKQILGSATAGSDTIPFLLNGGQVFLGVFIGKNWYQDKTSLLKKEYKNNLMTFIGRNALLVYLVHQIVIPVLLCGLALAFGFELR